MLEGSCAFKRSERIKTEVFEGAWFAYLRASRDCTTLVGLGIISEAEAAADPLCMCPVCSKMGDKRGKTQH